MTSRSLALELLVAFLQAYVFAMLTCMYLNDALASRPLNGRSTTLLNLLFSTNASS